MLPQRGERRDGRRVSRRPHALHRHCAAYRDRDVASFEQSAAHARRPDRGGRVGAGASSRIDRTASARRVIMSGISANLHREDPAAASGEIGAATAPVSLAQAYAYCARLAKSHYENFTIASWLMPREMRPSMHAIYAYAR